MRCNWLIFVSFLIETSVYSINQEQTLHSVIMQGYDFTSPPISDLNVPVLVSFQMSIYGIKKIDQKKNSAQVKVLLRLKWQDSRLTWNPSDYQGLSTIRFGSKFKNKVWTPDMSLRQINGKILFPNLDKTLLVCNYTGGILWTRPGVIDLVHKFDLRNYPFDIQTFKMTLESWANPSTRLRVSPYDPADQTFIKEKRFTENKQWIMVDNLEYTIKQLALPSASYDSVELRFSLQRQAASIIKMIFIPGVLISSLSICCYLLPMEGPVRVKFIGQVLLNMVVLTILLTTHLPISRDRIMLVETFQQFIIFIYSILVYILIIEKYRAYQQSLSRELLQILSKIEIQMAQERIRMAQKTLRQIIDKEAVNNKVQASLELQNTQAHLSAQDVFKVDLSQFKHFNNNIIINKFTNILRIVSVFTPTQLDFIFFLIILLSYIIYLLVTFIRIQGYQNEK